MKTDIDCLPCFLRQTVIALKQQLGIHAADAAIIRDVLAIVRDADLSLPPAYTTTRIHRLIRERLGTDPFARVKQEFNDRARALYPSLKERVTASDDRLSTAARLSIAGNIIDFGIYTSIDIEQSIGRALAPVIAVDDYPLFRQNLEQTTTVLYLLDNAGETVFDRILIEELQRLGKNVTAVVKGSPVLNDATIEDAEQTGLLDICRVIDNGSDAIGTILESTSPEFREAFASSDFIISKGQGNFETVEPGGKTTYYLFQSKCDVVSRELGLANGSMLLMRYRDSGTPLER